MFPLFVLGGAALAALFLEGCGSDHSETAPGYHNSADSSAPEDSASAAPSASASSDAPAPSASAAPSAPPLASDASAEAFGLKACEGDAPDDIKSNFIPSYVDEAKFKEILKGGAFCVKSAINLPQQSCRSAGRSFPFMSSSAMTKILQFRVQNGPQSGDSCQTFLELKEQDCQPVGSDLSGCDEKSFLKNLFLLGGKVSLANLLKGDGNGDGQKDLLVQFSNGTGILLAQTPAVPQCPPEGCGVDFGDQPQMPEAPSE